MNLSKSKSTLVSIIIRSMDRETLAEALNSVSDQEYSEIEVVLVNAKGGDHSEVASLCPRFPVRVVGDSVPLNRSRAANLGLRNARGEYLMFLDDDDWLYPGHISGLVGALAPSAGTQVAYAGVEYVLARGSKVREVMNESFDLRKLRLGNFIPIHAVLFHKALLENGSCFDERLDLYEDWDFWLQLARQTDFVHVDRVSAGYRDSGSSGVGPWQDGAKVLNARASIFEKWKEIWSGEELHELLDYAVHIQIPVVAKLHANIEEMELERYQLAALTATRIKEFERHVAELSSTLHERNLQIQQIYSSIGWKLLYPVRGISHGIHLARTLFECLRPLGQDPRKIMPTMYRLRQAWKKGRVPAVKQLLLQLPHEIGFDDVWQKYRQTFTPEIEAQIVERIAAMEELPLISVLMPTYNTPEHMLRQAIESVRAQLYPAWELCIADDASIQPHVRSILQKYAAENNQIKLVFCEKNGGISAATNSALELATGQYVALLDHDDVLEKQALFRLAESIVADDPDMIYSDEVLLSEDGCEVVSHAFRPTFSPERLRSSPYIVHLIAFRTELLRRLGGLDTSLKISQDYDLILRASEQALTIVHIPEVLYQWRQRGSSAGHKSEGGVMEASRNVLARHLDRCGEKGSVHDSSNFNYFEVRYPLVNGLRVAIIIPTKNHGELVRQCVESIERTVSEVPYDMVVVDHASDDPLSVEYFRELGNKHQVLRYEGVFNFSAINNWAVGQLKGKYTHYLFCNNDIEAIENGWLERMMELCQKPDVGIVGAKLYYPDLSTYQHAGVCVGMFGIAEHYGKFMDDKLPNGVVHPGYHGTLISNHELSAVTAACALMRKDAFERIGGFDEALAVGFGDVDLCLRTLMAGYRILFCPHAILIHHESYTRGKSTVDPHPKDSALFSKRWQHFLDQGDPYYNPNLSLYSTQWEIKCPMEFRLQISRRTFSRGLPGTLPTTQVPLLGQLSKVQR